MRNSAITRTSRRRWNIESRLPTLYFIAVAQVPFVLLERGSRRRSSCRCWGRRHRSTGTDLIQHASDLRHGIVDLGIQIGEPSVVVLDQLGHSLRRDRSVGADALLHDLLRGILEQIVDLPGLWCEIFHGLLSKLKPMPRVVLVIRERQDLLL